MNRDSIKKSFDKIKADEQSKDRIFNRVLEQKKEKEGLVFSQVLN